MQLNVSPTETSRPLEFSLYSYSALLSQTAMSPLAVLAVKSSTSIPRGVLLKHTNLLACASLARIFNTSVILATPRDLHDEPIGPGAIGCSVTRVPPGTIREGALR